MKSINKKIGIVLALIFFSLPVYTQDVKTKTVTPRHGTTKTYSYYLDEYGNEVLHGNFNFSLSRDVDSEKGTETLSCNFKNGKLHGLLVFKSDIRYFNEVLTTKLEWKWIEDKSLREKANLSVTLYEGVADGDIDFTYEGYNYKGKANNGILVDGTEFVISDREQKSIYRHLKPISADANLQNIPGRHTVSIVNYGEIANADKISNNTAKGIGIQYSEPDYVCFQLPLFVYKDFDKLSDIPESQDILNNEKITYSAAYKIFEKIDRNYYISRSDRALLRAKLQEIQDTEQTKRAAEYEVKKKLESQCKSLREEMDQKISKFRNHRHNYKPASVYQDNWGGCKYSRTAIDLITKRYNEIYNEMCGILDIQREFAGKCDENTVLALSSYITVLEENNFPARFDSLVALNGKITNISKKMCSIRSTYEKLSNKLYPYYLEVQESYLQKSQNASVTQLGNIFSEFEIVCNKMIELSTSKEKISQTEKLLKKAQTTEDKLKIFLQ